MADQPNGSNQATVPIRSKNAPGSTEVRLGNQSSEYARRNGIPEIAHKDSTSTEQNHTDQTDVTKISATLPDGTAYRQNWLEAMRGEARITLPFQHPETRDGKRDELRDAILERHFAENEISLQTRGAFLGRSKMKMQTPHQDTPSQPAIPEAYQEEEQMDDTNEEETTQYAPPTSQTASQQPANQEEEQEEEPSTLSMSTVKRGLLGPGIAAASATGIISLLALSTPDPTKATTLLKAITHFIA